MPLLYNNYYENDNKLSDSNEISTAYFFDAIINAISPGPLDIPYLYNQSIGHNVEHKIGDKYKSDQQFGSSPKYRYNTNNNNDCSSFICPRTASNVDSGKRFHVRTKKKKKSY